MKKKIMKTILLIGFLILISLYTNPISTTNHIENEKIRSNILSYRINSGDEPIYIHHNDNFTKYSSSGTGSITSPFIIEGFIITNSTHHLIEIVNTTKFFQIKNCDLDGITGNKCGIILYNVSHGTILENRIENCNYGISLDNYASNNTLIHNTVHNSSYGIDINYYSLENNISSNIIFDIKNDGLKVRGASDKNYIFNNTIYNCRDNGIALSSAFTNELERNTLFNNTHDGMNLVASNYNVIWFNTIIKSWRFGVYIGPGSSNNTIELNDFVTMNSGTTHASVENSSNTFDENYWDGWFSSEVSQIYWNDPYIVTYPDVQDIHPRTDPINIPSAHFYYLTKPIKITPHYTETLSGVVTFHWLESFGCPDKTVTYSLYYSSVGSNTWNEIASGLTQSYGVEWDTLTVPNAEYDLKVVASCSGVESVEGFSDGTYTLWNEITESNGTTDDNGNGGIAPSWTFLITFLAVISVLVVKRSNQK
ncbi:MAG: nitrous oxide reductase family maturation protein NosD [Candidatus Hodarchaeota archaeon]